jgi:hypothetical protein
MELKMRASPLATTFRVQDSRHLGQVVLMARARQTEVEMARAMAAALGDVDSDSASDLLERLHGAFPTVPLNVRVAALGFLMERMRQPLSS